jgi:AraC-like DNA-binding protein
MSVNIIQIVNGFGTVHCIILALVIVIPKRGNRKANLFLAILLFFFSLGMANSIYIQSGLYLIFPHFIGVFCPLIFTYGPLLYLYVKAHTESHFTFKIKYLLHFIPYLVLMLIGKPFYLANREFLIQTVENSVRNFPIESYLYPLLSIIQTSIYIGLVLITLKRHNKTIKKSFSNISRINFSWMYQFLIEFAIIWLLVALLTVGVLLKVIPGYLKVDIIYFCVSILVFKMGYHGLFQPEIFGMDSVEVVKKYKKSTLTHQNAEKYSALLTDFMQNKKTFEEPELTMQQLAGQLSIPSYHLSQVINEKFQQNFFGFINSYRVTEAKQALMDPIKKTETILNIAFDSGFNSIATFNRIFKSVTGISPSKFRKQYQ